MCFFVHFSVLLVLMCFYVFLCVFVGVVFCCYLFLCMFILFVLVFVCVVYLFLIGF